MKKCSFVLISIILFLFLSCSDKEPAKKAEKIFLNNGYERFVDFVNKEGYFPVKNAKQQDATPLLMAVEKGNYEDISLFLERGASVLEKDNQNKNAFDYCLANYNSKTMSLIIDKMPVSYWTEPDTNGDLPVVKAIKNCDDYDIIEKILSLSGDLNHKNNIGKTLLMYSAQYYTDVRLVKFFIDNLADYNIKNENEWTAIMYAARYNPNPYVLEELLIRGVNTDPNSVNLTLTMLASCNKNTGVLLTLLKYINEVQTSTNNGKTALMYACQNNASVSTLKLLIDEQIDINAKDSEGKTALMYALENYKSTEQIFFIISAGANVIDQDNSNKSVLVYLNDNKVLSNSSLRKAIDIKQKQESDANKSEENTINAITDEEKNG